MSQRDNDILNYVKRQLEKKSNRPQHFPLFTRFELNLLKNVQNKKIGLKQENLQVYQLHSFANPNFSLFDLFQLHFPEIVSRQKRKEYCTHLSKNAQNGDKKHQFKQQESIQFFRQLLFIVGLKSLLFSSYSTLSQTKKLLLKQVQHYSLENSTILVLKKQVQSIMQRIENKINQKKRWKILTLQTCKIVFNLLQQSKQNLLSLLYSSDQTSMILSQKYLFPNVLDFSLQDKKHFLASSICKLYKIPAFFSSHKQKIIRSYIQSCKQYSEMIYSHLQPDFIVQVKKQKQKEPVLIGLIHYLNLAKNGNIKQKIRKRTPLMFDVASLLLKSSVPFFSLNVQSLLFNQKSLKPYLNQIHLLTSGLGLQGDIGSVEYKLSTNPTPKPLEFQKCHLQKQEANQWFLELKYWDIFQSQQDRLTMKQISKIKQNIYVWRIICVLFYIINDSKHMMWTKYQQKYRHQEKKDESAPFDYQKYWKLCKNVYEEFRQTPNKIRKLLQIKGQQGYGLQKFDYSKEGMKQILDMPLNTITQSTQIIVKKQQTQLRKFRRILSNYLHNYLRTDSLLKRLDVQHRNISVLLAFILQQIYKLDQNTLFTEKQKDFLEKLDNEAKKVMGTKISSKNKSCQNCNLCKILQKCSSLIAIHKSILNFQKQTSQITSLCFEGLQQLISKEIKEKYKAEKRNQLIQSIKIADQNKQKEQHQISTMTIFLLIRTLKIMNGQNISKLKTFVIPFVTYFPKAQIKYTLEQWQERKIRLALATEIIESYQKKQQQNALLE